MEIIYRILPKVYLMYLCKSFRALEGHWLVIGYWVFIFMKLGAKSSQGY